MPDETVLRIIQETETSGPQGSFPRLSMPAADDAVGGQAPGSSPGTAIQATVLGGRAASASSPGGGAAGGLLASAPVAVGTIAAIATGAATLLAGAAVVTAGLAALGIAANKASNALSGVAESIGDISPDVAIGLATAELGELRARIDRAEEIGPELAQFIEARGEIDATITEIKTDLLKPLIPIATDIVAILADVLRVIKPITEMISEIDLASLVGDALEVALGPAQVQLLKALGIWERMEQSLAGLTADDGLDPMIQRELDHFFSGQNIDNPQVAPFAGRQGGRGVF